MDDKQTDDVLSKMDCRIQNRRAREREYLKKVNIRVNNYISPLYYQESPNQVIKNLSQHNYDLFKVIAILFPSFFSYVSSVHSVEEYFNIAIKGVNGEAIQDIQMSVKDIDSPGWVLCKFMLRAKEAALRLGDFKPIASMGMSSETYSRLKVTRWDEIDTDIEGELFDLSRTSIYGHDFYIDESIPKDTLVINLGNDGTTKFTFSLTKKEKTDA